MEKWIKFQERQKRRKEREGQKERKEERYKRKKSEKSCDRLRKEEITEVEKGSEKRIIGLCMFTTLWLKRGNSRQGFKCPER